LAKVNIDHAKELKELRKAMEAKHKAEFDALRLLWDKDRDDLQKAEEEVRTLREEKEDLEA